MELVQRAVRGDRKAQRQIYDEHAGRTYAVAVGIVGDREFAKDVAQEALIRAFGALDRFLGESKLGTWLYRITANTALTLLKKRRGQDLPVEVAERLPDDDDPQRRAMADEVLQIQIPEVEKLRWELRVSVLLEPSDAMATLQASESTVQRHKKVALKILIARLRPVSTRIDPQAFRDALLEIGTLRPDLLEEGPR